MCSWSDLRLAAAWGLAVLSAAAADHQSPGVVRNLPAFADRVKARIDHPLA